MIFADKLIQLRKKSGWSQEELAQQLNVSRQAVSKWEGAQSVPDLDRILQLSRLFGVSTDYLLKDELEDHAVVDAPEVAPDTRKVSMAEASEFLRIKQETAIPIAGATLLCILSPICLMMLAALSEHPGSGISENMAAGVGLIVLLVMVAAAVAIYLYSGGKTREFAYLEEEEIETEYGVTGMVRQRKKEFQECYTRMNILGTVFCVLSAVPLFAGIIMDENDPMLMMLGVSGVLVLVGIGAVCFILGGIPWASFEKLLQEGDYSREKKRQNKRLGAFSTAYWLTTTAVYLAWSFSTANWEFTWIVWPVAGVLYGAVRAVICATLNK